MGRRAFLVLGGIHEATLYFGLCGMGAGDTRFRRRRNCLTTNRQCLDERTCAWHPRCGILESGRHEMRCINGTHLSRYGEMLVAQSDVHDHEHHAHDRVHALNILTNMSITNDHDHEHTHEHEHRPRSRTYVRAIPIDHRHHYHLLQAHGYRAISSGIFAAGVDARADVIMVYKLIAVLVVRRMACQVSEIQFHEVGGDDAADITAARLNIRQLSAPEKHVVTGMQAKENTARCAACPSGYEA